MTIVRMYGMSAMCKGPILEKFFIQIFANIRLVRKYITK